MPRPLKNKPKSGDVTVTVVMPVELIDKTEERARELAAPGTHISRSDAVRVALHHFIETTNKENR